MLKCFGTASSTWILVFTNAHTKNTMKINRHNIDYDNDAGATDNEGDDNA